MNNQQVFNRVWNVFIKNKTELAFIKKYDYSPFFSNGYVPTYSHIPNKKGCAIGCCLPKAIASQLQMVATKLNSYGISHLLQSNSKAKTIDFVKLVFSNCDPNFLQDVQDLHDNRRLTEYTLKELGKVWELEI